MGSGSAVGWKANFVLLMTSSVPQQGVVGPSGPPGPPGFPGDLGLPVRASLWGVFISGHEVSGCGAKVGNVRV